MVETELIPLDELIAFLTKGAFLSGGIVIISALGLFAYTVSRRRLYGFNSPARGTQTDLAHMMILLGTMRDIFEQQKGLARRLTESFDNRVQSIREAVEATSTNLQALQHVVSTLETDMVQVKSALAQAHTPPELAASQRAARGPELPSSRVQEEPKLEAVAQPGSSSGAPSVLEDWVGLDLGTEEPDTSSYEVPEQVPQEPENAQAARQAFRTLLNLEQAKDELSRSEPPRALDALRGNGRAKFTPLQARIYEYRDAGMSVTEISRALGIGKGEVRLILSLRKDRS